jgi:predicted esterase
LNPSEVVRVAATVHGRILVERAASAVGALVGFHGYAQTAEDMLAELQQVPGADRWTKVSIQALHPFYIRGDSKVVATWMTRQDRDLAIADNIAYVQSALAEVLAEQTTELPLVMVGFSQGAAMAYRAALRSARPVAGIVALGGDIPPELRDDTSLTWPPVLIGVGDREEWYAGDKLATDLAFLQTRGITHQLVRFDGGHEWTEEFRTTVGAFLQSKGAHP